MAIPWWPVGRYSNSDHTACCLPIRHLVEADIAHNLDRQKIGLVAVVQSLLWARTVQAALLHRLAHAAWRRGLTPISEILLRISQLLFSVDIHYTARVGPGLVLRHCMNVVVGKHAQIGRNAMIFQGVTIGVRFGPGDGMPTVGDNVVLGAGSCLLGPIHVGDEAVIGANTVVTRDVPTRCLCTGSPARISDQLPW